MNKNKVLFITDCYYPNQTANSIIADIIIKEMKKRGYYIDCIAINQEINNPKNDEFGYEIYNVESTMYSKILKRQQQQELSFFNRITLFRYILGRKLNNLINLKKFPDVDINQSKKVFNIVRNLYSEKKYDIIIGVFRPFSAISAALKMKKNFPNIIVGAIYLDIISGSPKPSLIPQKLYERLCINGEKEVFNKLDFILMVKSGRKIYENDIFKPVNKKISYIDFPLFFNKKSDLRVKFEKNKINLVYAGTLNKDYRNPKSMLEILNLVSKNLDGITLHIYGRNNCKTIINEFKKIVSFEIVEHGMVEHKNVIAALKSSDFLINISNNMENIMPSKIIELFSIGKPIINFNFNDCSEKYSLKYPALHEISEKWESFDIDSLLDFIKREKGNTYNFEDLKDKFSEYTPKNIVDIIENNLSEINDRIIT